MNKSIKSILLISIILFISMSLNYKVHADTNDLLKANYGMVTIDRAPRVKRDADGISEAEKKNGKEVGSAFRIQASDDTIILQTEEIITNTSFSANQAFHRVHCFIDNCTNKEHQHYSSEEKSKYGKAYSLTYNKKYFTKDKAAQFVYQDTDSKGLSSKTSFNVKYKGNNTWSVNRSMRVEYSYSNGKVNFILRDNNGIASGKAALKIIDKNANKTISSLNAEQLKSKITNTGKNSNGKIISGIYSIDVNKLTKDASGNYFVQVQTTEGSGIGGSDMARFQVNETPVSSTPSTPKTTVSKVDINREIRIDVDKSNANKFKINLVDLGGISSISFKSYASDNAFIHDFSISGADCNTNKVLNTITKNKTKTNAVTYTGYNSNTHTATLQIHKKYFNKFAHSDKTMIFEIEAVDLSGLRCREKIYVKPTSSGWSSNRGARVSFSYSNGKLNLTMKDNDGIANNKASLEVIDKNNSDKKIADLNASDLSKKLINVKNENGKIIEGVYQIDINKLTRDSNNNYKIKTISRDANGHFRIEVIELKATITTI